MRMIILGATGAVGSSIASAAVAAGWEIGVLGRTRGRLSAIPNTSHQWVFDARDLGSLDDAFREIREVGFLPDAAVNAFGMTHRSPFLEQTFDQWDEVLAVNLRAMWRSIQLEAKLMISGLGGSIVNIGSVASLRANGWGEAPYIASKHGAVGLTKAAAVELGPDGVRVNIVCPSVMDTALSRPLDFGGANLDTLARKHPIGRLIHAEDVAETALWLCSKRAAGISGAVVAVDGGLTAK
jgi:NAD(P)-dependent dehydrogenase (short-subunit alcohol dehydrogenase family)